MSALALEPLLVARQEPRRLAPPSEMRPLTPEEAYAIQDRLREALLARGERVAVRATYTRLGAVSAQFV